jgi:glycosyltransferase involved in cell wall biosynthesis
MKKILIISGGIWVPAIDMAGTKAIFNHIKEINTNENIKIDVLTTVPKWAYKSNQEWLYKIECDLGIKIYSVNEPRHYFSKTLGQVISRVILLLKVYRLCKKNRYQIVHDYVSSPVLFLLSYFYLYVCKAKVIFTLCTYSNSLGNNNKSFLNSSIHSIIFLSKNMMKYYESQNTKEIGQYFIPLGIDLSYSKNLSEDISYNSEFIDKQIILYVGPLEERKGIFVFAEAAKLMNRCNPNNNYIFLIISFGKTDLDLNHEKSKNLVKSLIGSNVKILTGQQNILNYMTQCSVFVYPMVRMYGTLAQPHTLIEAIKSNIPIVYSTLEELDAFSSYGKSYRFQTGRADLCAKKIIQALDEVSNNKFENDILYNKDALKHYNIISQGKKVTDLYQSIS